MVFLSFFGLASVAACSPERPEWLGGEPRRPAADVVIGSKRTPMLNPKPGSYQGMQAPAAPQQMPPPKPPSLQDNPYDYYDNMGNPNPPAPASPPPSPQQQDEPTLFERWFDSSERKGPVPPAEQYQAERKHFHANPTFSDETVGIAPIPPGPQSAGNVAPSAGVDPAAPMPLVQPEPIMAAPTPMPVQVPPANATPQPLIAEEPAMMPPPASVVMEQEAPATPMPAEPKAIAASTPAPEPVAETEQKTSWFGRMFDRVNDKPETPEVEASKKMPYPELSSVPEKPEQFDELKESKDAQMQDLQLEHAIASEQRQMLGQEPSQLQASPVATPVPEPVVPPVPVTMSASAPVDTPVSEQAPVQTSAPATTMPSDGPVLLGHAYDSKLSAPTPESDTVMMRAVEPATMPESYPTPTPQEKKSWWNRLNVFSEDKGQSASNDNIIPEAQAASRMPPAPVEQMPPIAAGVAVSHPKDKAEEEAEDTSALPPPGMLETVETLPPSRYSDRADPAAQQ